MDIHLHSIGTDDATGVADFRTWADTFLRRGLRANPHDDTMTTFTRVDLAFTLLNFYDPAAIRDSLQQRPGINPQIQFRIATHDDYREVIETTAQAIQIRASKLALSNSPEPPPDGPDEHAHKQWRQERRMDIVFLCRRGKHRSVALAELVGNYLLANGCQSSTHHYMHYRWPAAC